MIGSFTVLAAEKRAPAFHDAPRPDVMLMAHAAEEPGGFVSRAKRRCASTGVDEMGRDTNAERGNPSTLVAVYRPTTLPFAQPITVTLRSRDGSPSGPTVTRFAGRFSGSSR